MNLENILITGSSGLVGAPLVTKLLNKSNLIVGLDPIINSKSQEKYKHISNPLKSVEDVTSLLKKYDITKIIHTGGISGPMLANENPNLIIENNIFFTMYLVEASRIYKKINRFIFCSSISAYGELAESNTTEEYRFAPENLYGATKASCDLLLKKYYENYELDIISLRISTIYGHRRSTSCFINEIISSGIKKNKITLPFKSDFCWPYVYVDDVVSCIEKCIFHEKEHFYDYNISGPDFPSYKKIVDEVSQYIDNLQVTFSNHNSISDRKLFSLEKVKKDMQWKPKYSIERGIKDYIYNLA
jgi:nucleoside-diphosphate-sugar epimerase